MKIGLKLFIGFAIIILLNAIVGLAVLNNLQAIGKYNDNMMQMDMLIDELNACRLVEKEFRSEYNQTYALEFQSHYSNLVRLADGLKASGELYPGYDRSGGDSIKSLVQSYHDLVLTNSKNSANVENLWLTEHDIRTKQGGLNDTSNGVRDAVLSWEKKNVSTSVLNYLYAIQPLERNLILTHNSTYLQEVYTLEDRLKEATRYDPDVSKALDRYNNNLLMLSYLFKQQEDVSVRVDSTIDELVGRVKVFDDGLSKAYSGIISDTKTAIISLIALSLGVSLIISLLVTVSISKPIGALSKITGDIARGDLRKRIDVRGDDEIIRLVDNFKKMIKALRERIEFNDTILRSIEDALIIIDENGKIFYFNDAAGEMTGYSYSEVMNKDIGELLGLKVSPDSGHFKGTGVMKGKNGRGLMVSYRVTPLNDGEGARQGTMIMIREIS